MTAGAPVRAGIAHAAALAAIHAGAFPATEAWSARSFATQLALPGVFALIDPAGGMVLARAVAGEAEILTIGVAPAARRQGVGARLLAAAMDIAAGGGAQEIFLEVSAANPAAQALYRAAGFAEAGRRRAYYPDGSDALLLRRPLSPGAAAGG